MGLQYLFIPVGLWGMHQLREGDNMILRQVVGTVVLLIVTLWVVFKPEQRPSIPGVWMFVAGASSGFLAGLTGIGGPPLAFYGSAHNWSNDRFRAYLWPQFFLVVPLLLALLTYSVGAQLLSYFALGLLAAPLLAMAVRVGLYMTRQWNQNDLRRATILILYLVGLSGALAPWLAR